MASTGDAFGPSILKSQDTQVNCTFNSFIGPDLNEPKHTTSEYIKHNKNAGLAIGTVHVLFSCAIIVYIIVFVLMKKSKQSMYQWIVLLQLLFCNMIEISYFFSYSKDMIQDNECGYDEKMYFAAISCCYYTICLSIAWHYQTFFRSIEKFVVLGHLPSKKSER